MLRLAAGDGVRLIDGQGHVADAELVDDDSRSARCLITAIRELPRPTPTIELATAIPKGPRGDAMANDLAQLGVDRLIPILTERTVVDPSPTKLLRYRKQAMEAAKQSGRGWFMLIDEPGLLTTAVDCDAGLKLVADPYADPLPDLHERLESVSAVRVVVGPEGGLTDQEVAVARDAGFLPWRYSPNVLRVETAAAAAVAILRAHD